MDTHCKCLNYVKLEEFVWNHYGRQFTWQVVCMLPSKTHVITQFIYLENYFVFCFSVIVSCAILQGWGGSFEIPDKFCPLPSVTQEHTLALYHCLFHFHTLTWESSKCLYFLILFLWFCSHFFSSSPCSCSSDLRRCFRGNSILK